MSQMSSGTQVPNDATKLQVVILVYPGMTALDMVGPQLFFATLGHVEVHLLWKDDTPIESDSGLTILPTGTLDACPPKIDVLFVGGSSRATWPLMEDSQVLEFLAQRGATASYVTSVCTGSMLLAAAGLLKGYRATGNWATRHLLERFGASPVDERVVVDRNRITGAGITAGIDFALRVSEQVRGPEFAQVQQLMFEYDPQPPFAAGSPAVAPPAILAAAKEQYRPLVEAATAVVHRVTG